MRKRVWLQALLSTLVITTLIACVTNIEQAGPPPPIGIIPSPTPFQRTFQSPIPQTSIATSSPTVTPSNAWQTHVENLGPNPFERSQWSPNGKYLLGRG